MKDDQLKTLDELLKDRLQEKKKIEKELSKNLNRIKEINTFLDSMTEASDFKVFSPRTAESLHREEIKEVREEKDKLEIDNDSYYKKIGKIEGWNRIATRKYRRILLKRLWLPERSNARFLKIRRNFCIFLKKDLHFSWKSGTIVLSHITA